MTLKAVYIARALLFCTLICLSRAKYIRRDFQFGVPSSELGSKLMQLGHNFIDNSREYFLEHLDEFLELYNNRPDKNNKCGIRINHAFAIYMVTKHIKPETVIESGVNSGVSTYFFRSAAPSAKIISIDPLDHPICGQPVRWIDNTNNEYLTGKKFKDIQDIDWVNYPGVNPATTLVYEDDHQMSYARVTYLQKQGFQHMILEDNYPQQGGLTRQEHANSVKSTLERADDPKAAWLKRNLETYHEIPPVVFGSNVLSDHHRRRQHCELYGNYTNLEYISRPLLMTDESREDYKIALHIQSTLGLNFTTNYGEYMNYCNIAYFHIKPFSGDEAPPNPPVPARKTW
eukprot:CAMPEP_0185034104 /NCGR_PEP_ID=MMETSP1103-20130426/23681_1 /TAXON_ID=36769 /ORGANISM="Paraphysomonas bandaiensis, Strain Caron Lab Isolate" /LENGTH=343 /DNA_ID=CAMNT_0027570627 /DNA_START=39 /DNA_END=1067 /DNA_ORIENTATION=-